MFTAAYEAQSSGARVKEYAFGKGHCDPCEGEPPDSQTLANLGFHAEDTGSDFMFTRLHRRYTPAQATQDLSLYATGLTDQEQIRYIEYVHELEAYLPVCGIGMVTDEPGECDFPPNPYEDADCDGDGRPDNEEDSGGPSDSPDADAAAEAEKSGCSCSSAPAGGLSLGGAIVMGILALRRRRSQT
jgi:MYXO-CTERM domain-containing protein